MLARRPGLRRGFFRDIDYVDFLAFGMTLFQIYYILTFGIDVLTARIVHLELGILIYLLSLRRKATGRLKSICLLALSIFSVIAASHLLLNFQYLVTERFPYVTPVSALEMTLGLGLIVVVLYALVGSAGVPFLVVTVCIIAYGFFGKYLPGILRHGGITLEGFVDGQYLTSFGLFGTPIGVSLIYVFVFMMFAKFLNVSGVGQLIMDLAVALGGGAKGGPTKIAVISSAAFGMLSGSAVSNVVTTGSFTIPLAKSIGYSPVFAAAIEAVASTGGSIMPPVMGVVAFLMAEYTGVPYSGIILYAIVPALLYYWAAFTAVHFRASKIGLQGVPKEQLPDWKNVLRTRGHLIIPIVVLVVLLIYGFSPPLSALMATVAIVLSSWLRKETGMNMKAIYSAMVGAAKMAAPMIVTLAAVGIIIGVFTRTGLGIRLGHLILALSQNNLLLMLFLVAATTIVLGLGLPTSACYLIQVALCAPSMVAALEGSGLATMDALLIAHFFIMYYACLAPITPPVALSSYAAAGLAGSNPMETGLLAWRIAIPIFVMPFLFIYRPEILFLGSPNVFVKIFTIILMFGAVALLEAGSEGYLIQKLGKKERILCLLSGITLFYPSLWADVLGILLAGGVLFLSRSKL